jgi:CubicO group peptidase (beta-lactamase class C family)
MKKLLAVALFALLVLPVSATTPTARPEELGFSPERLKRITELVQRNIEAKNFAGAVTLVARNGRIAHFEAQGLMDIESKKPMQKDAIFQIMSMTKPIVGVSIMMMMEEGKIRLADPVSRFIPEFKNLQVAVPQPDSAGAQIRAAADAPPRFYAVPAEREITVRDLLSHVSGLGSGTISNYSNRAVALKGKETLADFVPRLGKTVLEFQPGTRWAYSATNGFDTLARIVEVTSGMPFDRFTKSRIFDPLGMKDTFFYPSEGNPRMVTVYRNTEGALRRQANVSFMNGAYFSGGGGLFSTAEDYLQFGMMLLQNGQYNGKRLLAPRSVELMQTVAAPDTLPGRTRGEAFGLSVRVITDPVARGTYLSKGSFGWSGAHGTMFWVDPKEQIVAIEMIHTPSNEFRLDFETAVMQAIVGPVISTGGQH